MEIKFEKGIPAPQIGGLSEAVKFKLDIVNILDRIGVGESAVVTASDSDTGLIDKNIARWMPNIKLTLQVYELIKHTAYVCQFVPYDVWENHHTQIRIWRVN